MILKKEIEKIAEQKGVAKTTIDKDWVLGHFVDAIFSVPAYREKLVFKGGTCLRKCYFKDYRFSEDLDFDFYDIWYLSQNITDLNWPEIAKAFHQKMKFKGLAFTGIDQMINEENDTRLQAAWKNSLGHQVPQAQLANYKTVREELVKLFDKVFE